VIGRVGVLQIDAASVLCRSHYLPAFARLGPYPRALLDQMSWGEGGRELFEYWGHKASLLPLTTQPLLRWRMQAARRHDWRSCDPGRIAARALGVATERDVRDYFHLPAEDARARVSELVEAGELAPVLVDGLAPQMYLWRGARHPRQVHARALLSPFDSRLLDLKCA
jgi:uncharacterized protein YcaQ